MAPKVHPDTVLLIRLLNESSRRGDMYQLDDAELDECEAALNRLVSRAVAGETLDPYARRILTGLPKSSYRLTVRRRQGRPNVGAAVADFLRQRLVKGTKREAVYAAAEKHFGLTRRRILQIVREVKLGR